MESLQTLKETVNSKLKSKDNSKLKSKEEIDKQLEKLEKQKQSLKLNDKWEEAYVKVERILESKKSSFESFFNKKKRENEEKQRFWKEIDSEHFDLVCEEKTRKESLQVYVRKDEFVEEDTRVYNLIRTYKPYSEEKEKYKELETIWEEEREYEEYEIKFKPSNLVKVPESLEPFSQEQLEERYGNVGVHKNFDGRWEVRGLGYELSKRSYKTGRLVPKRTLKFFKLDLRRRYQQILTNKVEKEAKQKLYNLGYLDPEEDKHFSIGYRSNFKLDNGVKVYLNYTIDYDSGTGKVYVTNFEVPTPKLDTQEVDMFDAIEKLEKLKVTFD